MKQTRAKLNKTGTRLSGDNRPMIRLTLDFELSTEDYKIIDETIRPTMPDYEGNEADTADTITAIITWGTHRLYEEITGRKFTLDIDRAKA